MADKLAVIISLTPLWVALSNWLNKCKRFCKRVLTSKGVVITLHSYIDIQLHPLHCKSIW